MLTEQKLDFGKKVMEVAKQLLPIEEQRLMNIHPSTIKKKISSVADKTVKIIPMI